MYDKQKQSHCIILFLYIPIRIPQASSVIKSPTSKIDTNNTHYNFNHYINSSCRLLLKLFRLQYDAIISSIYCWLVIVNVEFRSYTEKALIFASTKFRDSLIYANSRFVVMPSKSCYMNLSVFLIRTILRRKKATAQITNCSSKVKKLLYNITLCVDRT